MIKQCTAVALMAMTGLTVTVAWAARETHIFDVSLTIPSRPFYITPAEPDWIHRPQILEWDYSTSSLGSVRKNFDVRHDSSAIEARLEDVPYLSSGLPGGVVNLRVWFNGVALSNMEYREVVSKEEAAVGKRVLLEIVPTKPPSGYLSGDYSGSVLLMFNAPTPGA